MILYSTGCPQCNVLKQKLDMKNIDYTYCELTADEMINKGFSSTPILIVDNKTMNFSKAIEWINNQG